MVLWRSFDHFDHSGQSSARKFFRESVDLFLFPRRGFSGKQAFNPPENMKTLRLAAHPWRAGSAFQRIQRALLRFQQNKRFLPQSGPGRAIDYALGQWSAVSVYLSNGLVEILFQTE
jgi:hypothetical protein